MHILRAAIVAGLIASTPAQGQELSPKYIATLCTAMGGLSETTMVLRQRGVTMPQVLDILEKGGVAGSLVGETMSEVTVQAFRIARSDDPVTQQRVAEIFRDHIEMACLEGMQGK